MIYFPFFQNSGTVSRIVVLFPHWAVHKLSNPRSWIWGVFLTFGGLLGVLVLFPFCLPCPSSVLPCSGDRVKIHIIIILFSMLNNAYDFLMCNNVSSDLNGACPGEPIQGATP